jgi:hypothetical protein
MVKKPEIVINLHPSSSLPHRNSRGRKPLMIDLTAINTFNQPNVSRLRFSVLQRASMERFYRKNRDPFLRSKSDRD